MNNQNVETDIQAKGLRAPRVTPEDIEAEIASEFYFTASEGAAGAYMAHGQYQCTRHNDDVASIHMDLMTFCVLILRNGFTVTGEAACVSPENFDAELGRKIARQHAVDKMWPLLGFRLQDRLAQRETHVELSGDEKQRIADEGPGQVLAADNPSLEQRARHAHEINRAYCEATGDHSQLAWDAAPQWQRDSAVAGVKRVLAGEPAEQLHESWCAHKRADGWTYGRTKDPEAKTHPCLVPYDQLPASQRVKDHLFRAAVLLS